MSPIKANGGYEDGTVKAVLGSLQNLSTVLVSPRGFPGLSEILGAWPAQAGSPLQGPIQPHC